jgi:pilus assembly protein CpaB
MDRRFLTVLGVSLLFALVVSGIFYQLSRSGGGSKASGPVEQSDLVIAAKPLSVGMTLKPEDVKVVKIALTAFPKGGFTKVADVLERPLISNILLEEPVLDGRLAPKGSGSGLAPVIPLGMRAVSVRVTDVVGVAGFVQPGLRVDVLVTGRPPRGQMSMTTTILQNLLVLSSGTTLVADQRGQAINAPSVTLLVWPQQAEILTLASNEGRIQLVLRNSKDDKVEATPGSTALKLYSGGKIRAALNSGEWLNVAPGEEESGDEAEKPKPKPRVRVEPPAPRQPPPVFVPKLVPQPIQEPIVLIRGDKRTLESVLPSRIDNPADGSPSESAKAAEGETKP